MSTSGLTRQKPAGLDVGRVIPVAARAIQTGSPEELTSVLSDALHDEIKRRLDHVLELKARSDRSLSEAREYTSAMLGLQVWSHRLYGAMHDSVHGAESKRE